MFGFQKRFLRLTRAKKRFIQVLADTLLILLSFAMAMALRLESFDFVRDPQVWYAILLALPVSIVVFVRLGFYRAVVRYITSRALRTITIGIIASAATLLIVSLLLDLPVPRAVPAIYGLLAFIWVGGVRFAFRSMIARRDRGQRRAAIIYGAGESGRQVLSALQQGGEYTPIAFVDDAQPLQGIEIGGYRVHPPAELPGLIARHDIAAVLLAVPSATLGQRRTILERLEPLPVHVQTLPGISDLVSGKTQFSDFREVPIEDFLGRDQVPTRAELKQARIAGKVVMVTGAGGSIGSELCRQILTQSPAQLILFEMAEPSLYEVEMELRTLAKARGLPVKIVPLLGSVQNPRRVEAALRRFGVQTLFHAAAYKHVPLVEENVVEGVRNNAFGTLTLAQAAVAANVEAFIMISTDKAVRPTNVMGATKRLAELICQAFAAEQSETQFSMVRFGNVLGSSGSVIPRFRAQIAAGGPVTVTDKRITRYFMTIPEAAQLVIHASAMARGGDVFVLDMGAPVRIVDLAARIIRLSGLKPFIRDPKDATEGIPGDNGDIEITYVGLRIGEKLYEELLIGTDSAPTEHTRIMTATEVSMPWNDLSPLLNRLLAACDAQNIKQIRTILQAAPTGYAPSDDIADLMWQDGWRDEDFMAAE